MVNTLLRQAISRLTERQSSDLPYCQRLFFSYLLDTVRFRTKHCVSQTWYPKPPFADCFRSACSSPSSGCFFCPSIHRRKIETQLWHNTGTRSNAAFSPMSDNERVICWSRECDLCSRYGQLSSVHKWTAESTEKMKADPKDKVHYHHRQHHSSEVNEEDNDGGNEQATKVHCRHGKQYALACAYLCVYGLSQSHIYARQSPWSRQK